MTPKPFWFATPLVLITALTAACGSQLASPGPSDGGGGQGGADQRSSFKKIIYATIWITSGATAGTCAATTTPGRLQVRKGEDIEWSVVDICNATLGYSKNIEIKDWSLLVGSSNCSDGNPTPVDAAATGKQHIRRGIRPQCNSGAKFKYAIYVEGSMDALADPELEIAP